MYELPIVISYMKAMAYKHRKAHLCGAYKLLMSNIIAALNGNFHEKHSSLQNCLLEKAALSIKFSTYHIGECLAGLMFGKLLN